MHKTEDLTTKNDNARLNVCLCYNSKHEILRAVTNLAEKQATGELSDPTEEDFDRELYGGFNCKPDILIRTSNEVRLSNFLLRQTDESQY